MDFDGDGTLDLISGSYDPGDIYLFRGLGKGGFERGGPIRDEKGVPLVHHPVELAKFQAMKASDSSSQGAIQLRVASFGSWPAAVDWDGDGDLDVVIGAFNGSVWLRTNSGTRSKPVYAAESVPVLADGKPIKLHGHAAPVAADWDGDGLWDLVLGSDNGRVAWFRNRGSKTAPEFAAGETLLEARAETKSLIQLVPPDETPGRGVRNQIAVADYDGDGKLDLLVGDYSSVQRFKSGVDAAGRERVRDLDAQIAATVEVEGTTNGKVTSSNLAALKRERQALVEAGTTQSFVWLYLRR